MADKDDIRVRVLMGLEPGTEIRDGNVDGLVSLVPRVNLGVHHVGILDRRFDVAVNVCWERPEGLVVSIEAVDVDYQEPSSAPVRVRVAEGRGNQRL